MAELPMLVAEDFWNLRFVMEMQPAPDGRSIAYTVEWNDQEANETHSAIWLYDVPTSQTRRLTAGLKQDRSPRWSPDGRQLAFVSSRDGAGTQIYLLQLEGGDAQALTMMRRGADEPFWSADGRWIGFESEVRPGDTPTAPDTRDAATRKREEKDEEQEREPAHGRNSVRDRIRSHGAEGGRARKFAGGAWLVACTTRLGWSFSRGAWRGKLAWFLSRHRRHRQTRNRQNRPAATEHRQANVRRVIVRQCTCREPSSGTADQASR